jgi:hypothetical protein
MGNGESSISEDQARKAAGTLWSDSKFDALKGPDGRIPLPLSPEALKIFQGPDPTPPRKRPEGEMPVKDVVPQNLWLTHNYVHCNPFLLFEEKKGFCDEPPHPDRHGNLRYPVDWHPHMGMCVVTYVRDGNGRFADSLGNLFEVTSPGVAWWNCGGGLELAQGGANPKGTMEHTFEFWLIAPHLARYDNPLGGCANLEKHGAVSRDDSLAEEPSQVLSAASAVSGGASVASGGGGTHATWGDGSTVKPKKKRPKAKPEFIRRIDLGQINNVDVGHGRLISGRVPNPEASRSGKPKRDLVGPVKTKTPLLIMDFELDATIEGRYTQVMQDNRRCPLVHAVAFQRGSPPALQLIPSPVWLRATLRR